jgi:hypothetical protein
MESTAFFEKKISLTPSDFNEVKTTSIDDILLRKAKESIEKKCSENGFVLPGSIRLLSRSMGHFESARFTGDAVYYIKLEGRVIYPADGIRITGEVIRKNKMGLYINYQDAIRIQVPRDLHIGNEEYDSVQVGEMVQIELKRSKFAIYDPYILASGMFIARGSEPITSQDLDVASQDSDVASQDSDVASQDSEPEEKYASESEASEED